MLVDFIVQNREVILTKTRERVAKRLAELSKGVPQFLDQLLRRLKEPKSHTNELKDSLKLDATQQGELLQIAGYTIAQMVYDYGDICQVITQLAETKSLNITIEEFKVFNSCLDDAIAGSVTEFTRVSDASHTVAETERLGILAHELRNRVGAVLLSFQSIQSGRVGSGGSVGSLIVRNLHRMSTLIDRALVEVRLGAGSIHSRRVNIFKFIEEVELEASFEATAKDMSLVSEVNDPSLNIFVDSQILTGVVINLLQNAMKFSEEKSIIHLRVNKTDAGVEIEVEDQCGGISAETEKLMFKAFSQLSNDKTGVGLGLTICEKGIKACGGTMAVENIPGKGCKFKLSLPLCPEDK
jgi:signal transduction histidine kinase